MSTRHASHRRLLFSGVAALGVVSFAGGQAWARNAATTLPPQTLTLNSVATYQPGFSAVIADFEKAYPGVTINPVYTVAGSTSPTLLPTEFAAGNGTDLVYLAPGNGSPAAVIPFAKAGYLMPLTNQPWAKNTYKPTESLFMNRNQLYTWDMGSSTTLISYNKSYFAAHGLSVPKTFAQLMTLCKTISAAGEIPIAWGAASSAVNSGDMVVLSVNNVFSSDPQWLTKRAKNKTSFTSSTAWRNTLVQIQQMQSAGCFQPGVAGLGVAQMVSEFGSGQAAMMFTNAGLDASLEQQDPNLHIGLFVPPATKESSTRLTVTPAGGIGIWSKSQHKAAAQVFLNFLSTAHESAQFALLNHLISDGEERRGTVPTQYADVQYLFNKHLTVSSPNWRWPNSAFATLAGDQLTGLFTGQLTVSQMLGDLDVDWTSGNT